MHRFLFALLALGLVACSSEVASETGYQIATAEELREARIIAVMSHADWCPSCKVVEMTVEKVRASAKLEGIAFTQIDYTSKDSAAFFIDGEALGVGEAIRDRFGEEIFTGRMLLVDAKTQAILGEIDKEMAGTQVLQAFRDALAHPS